MTLEYLLLFGGGLVGGFVSGLTGFGTGIAAMPFWIAAAPAVIAAQLAAAGGAVGQIQTIHSIWAHVRWRDLSHFILAGLVGVPIGTLLLPLISERAFKVGVGVFLIVFCGFLLWARGRWLLTRRRPIADVGIGFGGGIMAGVAGLSGPLPIVWASFHDWPREQKRALFQIFNLVILLTMLISSALAGLMTPAFFVALALAIPGTVIGSYFGLLVYQKLDSRGFDRVVLWLLVATGLALIVANASG